MNLLDAEEGEEYIVKDITADDEEMGGVSVFSGLLQRRTDYGGFPCERWLCRFH